MAKEGLRPAIYEALATTPKSVAWQVALERGLISRAGKDWRFACVEEQEDARAFIQGCWGYMRNGMPKKEAESWCRVLVDLLLEYEGSLGKRPSWTRVYCGAVHEPQ